MRAILWTFIIWQMFWLNIFMPGHTRGVIRFDDKPASKAKSCCESEAPVEEIKSSCCSGLPIGAPVKGKEPTQDQKNRCAICYIAKGYHFPVVFSFELQLTGKLIEQIEVVDAQIKSVEFAFPYYPSGPPVA